MKGRKLRYFVTLTASLAFFLQGYASTVLNGLVSLDSFLKTFPLIDTIHTVGQEKARHAAFLGTTVSLYEVGCAIGAVLCYFYGDMLGRRRTILIMNVIVVIGVVLLASSFDLSQLIVGRTIYGVAIGGYHATFPMYLSECVNEKQRGQAVVTSGTMGLIGAAVAPWIALGFFFVKHSSVSWRFPLALPMLPAILLCIAAFFLPESPRWLARNHRLDEAKKCYAAFEDDMSEDEIMDKLDCINDHAATSKHSRALYRAMIAIMISILTTMNGVNVISYYSTSTFQTQLKLSPTISRVLTGALKTTEILFSIVAIFMIDRFGRRKLMLGTAIALAVSMAVLGGLGQGIPNTAQYHASIFFMFLCMCAHPMGHHLIPNLYGAEISPMNIRHRITSMSSTVHWLFNFLIAMVTPIAFTSIKASYYFVYMAINVALVFFIFFLCPETKGQTLETIDDLFKSHENASSIRRTSSKLSDGIEICDQYLESPVGSDKNVKAGYFVTKRQIDSDIIVVEVPPKLDV